MREKKPVFPFLIHTRQQSERAFKERERERKMKESGDSKLQVEVALTVLDTMRSKYVLVKCIFIWEKELKRNLPYSHPSEFYQHYNTSFKSISPDHSNHFSVKLP